MLYLSLKATRRGNGFEPLALSCTMQTAAGYNYYVHADFSDRVSTFMQLPIGCKQPWNSKLVRMCLVGPVLLGRRFDMGPDTSYFPRTT